MPPDQATVLIEVIGARPLARKHRRAIESHIRRNSFSEGWDRVVIFSPNLLSPADFADDDEAFCFRVDLFDFDVLAVVHLPGVHDVGMF